MSLALLLLVATSTFDFSTACENPDVRERFSAAIHKWAQDADPTGESLKGMNFAVTDARLVSYTPNESTICRATVAFDFKQPSGHVAKIEYRDLNYRVYQNQFNSIDTTAYMWPTAAQMQDSDNAINRAMVVDGETFEQAWDKQRGQTSKQQAANKAQWDALVRQKQADDDAETRRRQGPCEATGGTWGYYRGKLGCYFTTVGQ